RQSTGTRSARPGLAKGRASPWAPGVRRIGRFPCLEEIRGDTYPLGKTAKWPARDMHPDAAKMGESPVICNACRHENPAGARFCNDCGAPLAAATITREPRSYTPRHLVEKILASRSALRGERKLVTVLFADVARSMELAERVDPEEWHRLLDR